MPNANYLKGRRAEYRTIRWLEGQGYRAVRTAGSHGPFDLIGWRAGEVVLVQVKSGGAKDDGKLAALHALNLPVKRLTVLWPPRASHPVVVDLGVERTLSDAA